MKTYPLPEFLKDVCSEKNYKKWLQRKAEAHVKRDRARGNVKATVTEYKKAMHNAVVECGGRDWYTGENLRWDLIGKYDNESSKKDRRKYKATLAYLPTVDHVCDGLGPADFKICSWRVNDAKSDLSHEEFVKLCEAVVRHYKTFCISDQKKEV
jgi:hypothetical protein